MNRLLVVDDEMNIRKVIREYAEFNDFLVDEAADGEQAVEMAYNNDYDIIVMDIMMPKLDGYSACREIRKSKNTPVILLSARSEEYDKLFGFELGIDDYVIKPFSPKELMARINAVIARSRAMNARAAAAASANALEEKEQSLDFEGLHIDKAGRSVTVDGEKAELTPKEYELLCYLAEHKGIALSREKILNNVWNYDYFGDARTIDTHVKKLRSKMGEKGEYIKTIWGMGYKFEVSE